MSQTAGVVSSLEGDPSGIDPGQGEIEVPSERAVHRGGDDPGTGSRVLVDPGLQLGDDLGVAFDHDRGAGDRPVGLVEEEWGEIGELVAGEGNGVARDEIHFGVGGQVGGRGQPDGGQCYPDVRELSTPVTGIAGHYVERRPSP